MHRDANAGVIAEAPSMTEDQCRQILREAMDAELALVSSIHTATTHDLVKNGRTGFVIDSSDADSSGAILLRALDLSPGARTQIGYAVYERVKSCDLTWLQMP